MAYDKTIFHAPFSSWGRQCHLCLLSSPQKRAAFRPVECRLPSPGPLAALLKIKPMRVMRRRQRIVREKEKQIQRKGKKWWTKWIQRDVCASACVTMFLTKTRNHLWDVHPTRLALGPRYNGSDLRDGLRLGSLPPRLQSSII